MFLHLYWNFRQIYLLTCKYFPWNCTRCHYDSGINIRKCLTNDLLEVYLQVNCVNNVSHPDALITIWSKTLCNRKTNNVSKILPVEFRRNKNINFFGFGNESLPNDIYYSFFVTSSFYIYVCKLECSVVSLINVPSGWFSIVFWTTLKPEV